jgi:glutathione synthase/RimK-type ligase-like ATP-grasp enzyme
MRRRCAFLTMSDFGDFVSDAELSFEPLAELGWHAEMVPWRDPDIDWSDYDLVYICTPWDYQDNVDEFLNVLEKIDASPATLVNSIDLVHWNLEKNYLGDLELRGAAIVPSLFCDKFDSAAVSTWFEAHRSDKVVVKPLVGANADHITVVNKPVSEEAVASLRETYSSRPFFVQPFMERIVSEGEYSTFFFNGEYSHAILKKPAADDFRTQEEHGAEILSVAAPQALIDTAHDVVALVEPRPVYVRADFVSNERDEFLVMELELIEPSLYLRTDPGSAARFARAMNEWFEILTCK